MSKTLMGIAVLVAAGVTAWILQRPAGARFEREIAWAGKGVWLKADTHVHTRFSDGGHTVDEVADRAVGNGCDVLAITDHTDGGLQAATPDYHAAIAAARARVPELVILTGIEWNVPPGKGQDHAVVLFPPELDDPAVMGEFKEKFDDHNKEGENPALAEAAFTWLRDRSAKATAPAVVFLNHPSRRAADVLAVHTELTWLATIGTGVYAGAEGAPGHQNATPLGAYAGRLTLDDRWDPAIAPPGAAWDQALGAGIEMWGALATSDFHSTDNGDYGPCQFSATWIYASARSADAALKALKAGAFFGVHGDIAREVQLTLTADGLARPAIPGESIRLGSNRQVALELRARVPAVDWSGQPNRLDEVQMVGASGGGATVLESGRLPEGGLRLEVTVPADGLAIRARGRRVVLDGPDFQFYTNPILVN